MVAILAPENDSLTPLLDTNSCLVTKARPFFIDSQFIQRFAFIEALMHCSQSKSLKVQRIGYGVGFQLTRRERRNRWQILLDWLLRQRNVVYLLLIMLTHLPSILTNKSLPVYLLRS